MKAQLSQGAREVQRKRLRRTPKRLRKGQAQSPLQPRIRGRKRWLSLQAALPLWMIIDHRQQCGLFSTHSSSSPLYVLLFPLSRCAFLIRWSAPGEQVAQHYMSTGDLKAIVEYALDPVMVGCMLLILLVWMWAGIERKLAPWEYRACYWCMFLSQLLGRTLTKFSWVQIFSTGQSFI